LVTIRGNGNAVLGRSHPRARRGGLWLLFRLAWECVAVVLGRAGRGRAGRGGELDHGPFFFRHVGERFSERGHELDGEHDELERDGDHLPLLRVVDDGGAGGRLVQLDRL
jgi:hypothetical protein